MTILQIRVVVWTAELGSISSAAKELNLSQPNASSCIRLLEEEIGFQIFHRTNAGAVITDKGEQFLKHARQILEQNEKIMWLRNTEEIYRLRIGSLYYFPAVKSFLDLCEMHRDDREADFRFYSVSVDDGIDCLARRDLDLIIAPVMKHQIAGLMSKCKRSSTELTSICQIPAVINVRKQHPAVADGRCMNLTQGSSAMKEFPYISYRNLLEDTSSISYNESDFVQCSYKIYVDDVDAKLRMISVTNGFSFGILSTNETMEQYGILSIPVPGVTLEMFVLTRPNDTARREISEYLAMLRKELIPVIEHGG